jgi:hypothetical protein
VGPKQSENAHSGRNRSEGWRHAKRTGHSLESTLAKRVTEDDGFASQLQRACFGPVDATGATASTGAANARQVESVLGGRTPRKIDISVEWRNGQKTRLSLKKSVTGQVWLVTPERLFRAFEAHYDEQVPEHVKSCVRKFIGPLNDPELSYACRFSDHRDMEQHQQRLVGSTLQVSEPTSWPATLGWLQEKMPQLTELCFSKGLCGNPEDHADFVWYHTDTNAQSGNVEIYRIADIVDGVRRVPPQDRAKVGLKNGGSTVALPFGFLQMHRPRGRNQAQFHHDLDKVRRLVEPAGSKR